MISASEFYKWAKVFNLVGGTPIPGGDVFGPASSTVNAIARYFDITGKIIKNSPVTINDSGDITTPGVVLAGSTISTFTTATTITASQLKGGILTFNPPDGNQDFPLDTAANIYVAMGSPAVGTTLKVLLINKTTNQFHINSPDSNLSLSGMPTQTNYGLQTFDLSFRVTNISPVQISVSGGQDASFAKIFSGTIDGADIGQSTEAKGRFSELEAIESILFPNNNQNQVYVSSTTPTGVPDGSIYNPYPNVGAVMAAGLPADASNPISIIMSGVITETANVALKPYYSITGNEAFGTQWNLNTFNLTLDPAWDTGFAFGTMSRLLVSGIGSVNFDTSAFTGGGVKLFFNNSIFYAVNVTVTGDASTIWAMLPGCNMQPPLTLTLNNISQGFLVSDVFNGNLLVTSASVGHDTTVFTQGLLMLPGSSITATSTGTDACNLTINSSTVQPASLTGNGANTTIYMDVGSYTPATLTAGAQQVVVPVGIGAGGTGITTLPTNGQLLVGNTSNSYDLATIVGAGGITVSYSDVFKTYTVDGSGSSSGLPFGYWYGLHISYSSSTEVLMEGGAAIDSTNTYSIYSSINTLDITTSGINGLDTGTVSPSTQYYVYNIGDSNLVNPGVSIASISPVSPAFHPGYDIFRGIGTFSTDALSDIDPFSVVDLINKAPLNAPSITGIERVDAIRGRNANLRINAANSGEPIYLGHTFADVIVNVGFNATLTSFEVGDTTNGLQFKVDPTDGKVKVNTVLKALNQLEFTNRNVTVVYVSPNGSDVVGVGDGSYYQPYATIAYAESLITTASVTNPFTILVTGSVTEASRVVKPHVTVCGISRETTITISAVTLHSDWNSVVGGARGGFQNCTLIADTDISLTTPSPDLFFDLININKVDTAAGSLVGTLGPMLYIESSFIDGFFSIEDTNFTSYNSIMGGDVTFESNTIDVTLVSYFTSFGSDTILTCGANNLFVYRTCSPSEGGTFVLTGSNIYLEIDGVSYPNTVTGTPSSLILKNTPALNADNVFTGKNSFSSLSMESGGLFLDNQQPGSIITTSGTLSTADLLSKIIVTNPSSPINLDWGSASSLVGAMANPIIGSALDIIIVNKGSDSVTLTNTTDPTHVGTAGLVGGNSSVLLPGATVAYRLVVVDISTPAIAIFGGGSSTVSGVPTLAGNNVFTGQNFFATEFLGCDFFTTSFIGCNGPFYTTSTLGFAANESGVKTLSSFTLTASEVANIIVRLNGSLASQTVFMPTGANFDAQILASYPSGSVPTFTTFHLRVINESTTATATMTANTNFLISNSAIATLLPGTYKDFLINKTAGTPEYTLY